MNIVAFSDFHGSDNALNKAIDVILKHDPELVMIAGDIADNDFEKAKNFLLSFDSLGIKAFYVPGNMDNKKLLENFGLKYVKNIHKKIIDYKDFKIIGLGGSNRTPFNTPIEYDEEEIKEFLINIKVNEKNKIILLTHCPPRNTKVDKTFIGIHAGSIEIRNFIEKSKPILTICGHIHEAYGVDRLNGCLIFNVSSAKQNRYGFINLEGNKIHTKLLKLY